MKSTIKKLSDTKVEIKVTLEKTELEPAQKKAVARLATELKLPGFRKGKVPAEMAEKHLNPNDIAQTALDIAIRLAVPQVFETHKATPIVLPNVSVTKFVPGESAEFIAAADVLPDVKLGDYKKLVVRRDILNT